MKKRYIYFMIVFVSHTIQADCSMDLMVSSARYVFAIEKSKLNDHQEQPCKVFYSEYTKCNEKEKKFMAKRIDLKKLLGLICMPHTQPPLPKSQEML